MPASRTGRIRQSLVIPKTGAIVEHDRIIQYCKDFLAPYKAPKVVEVVFSLPRTALGKIDRGKLELAELENTGR